MTNTEQHQRRFHRVCRDSQGVVNAYVCRDCGALDRPRPIRIVYRKARKQHRNPPSTYKVTLRHILKHVIRDRHVAKSIARQARLDARKAGATVMQP